MSILLGGDVPSVVSRDVGLLLQNEEFYADMHVIAERTNRFLPDLHVLLTEKMEELYDTRLGAAFIRGAGIYEIIAHFDTDTMRELSSIEGRLAAAKTSRLLAQLSLDQTIERASAAREACYEDIPSLMDIGSLALSCYTRDSQSALGFGLAGIATMRQLHVSAVDNGVSIALAQLSSDD